VHEFLVTSLGGGTTPVAITHGEFQTLAGFAPTTTTYDVCSITQKTLDGKPVHSTPYYKARLNRPGVEVLFYTQESR
jgi:hypothetical protein